MKPLAKVETMEAVEVQRRQRRRPPRHWPPLATLATMETVVHMTTATSATSTPVPCTYVCGPLELCPFGKAKNFPNREGDVDEKGRNVLALSARKFLSKSRGVYSKTLYVGHHATNAGK